MISPNLVVSVSQMHFVAPFSPHHPLKYLCNKTNLNVKQVCYVTPPPFCNCATHLLSFFFFLFLNVLLTHTHTHTHAVPLFLTHPFTTSLDTGRNRVMMCNLVLITTSDFALRFTSLHQPSQSDSQEGDVNVRPQVITAITARHRSCPRVHMYARACGGVHGCTRSAAVLFEHLNAMVCFFFLRLYN